MHEKKPPVALNPRLRTALDYVPLAVFFIAYKCAGLFAATAAIMITRAATLLFFYLVEKRFAVVPFLTALVIGVAGGLTLWLHDETYIKMKPTFINLLFAGVLLIGSLRRKGLIRHALVAGFALDEEGWHILSLRFGFFFLFLAGLNELVWRNVSTDAWVNFKIFGLVGMTILFAAAQAPFIGRHILKEE